MVEEHEETAAEIGRRYDPGAEAEVLLATERSPDSYVAALVAKKLYADAVEFLAYWLPKREGAWWGCQCAWHVYRPQPPAEAAAALQAVVRWVLEPTEERRRAAGTAGASAGADTAAGCLTLAAFYSDGSMAPPGLPDVPAPHFLANTALVGALQLAAHHGPPARIQDNYRQFVSLGLDVAHAKNRWNPS